MSAVMMTDEMLEHYADIFLKKGIREFSEISFLEWLEVDVLPHLGMISVWK